MEGDAQPELPPVRNCVSVPEAWVHDAQFEEVECSPAQVAFIEEVFYKSHLRNDDPDEDIEAPPEQGLQGAARGAMGYRKFRAYMDRIFRKANPLDITAGHLLWYYNRSPSHKSISERKGERRSAPMISRRCHSADPSNP